MPNKKEHIQEVLPIVEKRLGFKDICTALWIWGEPLLQLF